MAVTENRVALALAQAEASPDGLLVVAPDGRIVFWNARFSEIWGFPSDLLDLQDDTAALAAAMTRVADPVGFARRVDEVYANPIAPVQDEIELVDGRILDRYGTPLRTPAGEYIGWSWHFRDVTFHRRNERELRELADTLQASLLPPRPPQIPGMEVATHYLPADHRAGVGGDFFDVFRIATNEWALTIGDVCGKGPRAAALTTLARQSLRGAAVHTALPSAVLADLNAAICAEPESDGRFCSVVYTMLELDACGAWATLACGGHPRPIVVRRAGWIDVRGQPGSLIGMFDVADVADDRVGLGPGDALVFCTDGITEARDDAGEMFGEERLPEVLLTHTGSSATELAQAVLDEALSFSAGRREDDIALLVVKVPDDATADPAGRLADAVGVATDTSASITPHVVGQEYAGLRQQRPSPPREARIRLPADLRSAAEARRFLGGVLRSWRMPEVLFGDVELLTSEVAANAVRHAHSDFTVVVRYDGAAVRVEVGDGSRVLPKPRHPDPEATGGRGLFLVDQMAARWGVSATVDGKRVWFEVPAS